jgi:hypothetical protein
MIVFVADEDAFTGSAHAMLDIVLLEAFEASEDRGVFFWLGLFGAECVIGEGVEADSFGLVPIEGFGENRRVGGLQCGGGYGRHGGWIRQRLWRG